MHKFIRWYNQNRAEAIIIFAIIAFGFILLCTLNGIVARESEQKKNEVSFRNSSSTNQSTTISKANESVLSGNKVPTSSSNINQSIIKQFVDYCNNSKIQEAYDMLTDECKEALYPSVSNFSNNYYIRNFSTDRMYSLENWYSTSSSYTYYIKYTNDVLATGDINSSDNKGDYITVVYTDNGYKLNLGGYIGREIRNQTSYKDGIGIKINWIDTYMDYSILNISITNNTENTICIDTKERLKTTFVYDENNVRYSAFLNEIASSDLVLSAGTTNSLNIKFNKAYNPEIPIRGVGFRDIVLNYEKYTTSAEKKQVTTINT